MIRRVVALLAIVLAAWLALGRTSDSGTATPRSTDGSAAANAGGATSSATRPKSTADPAATSRSRVGFRSNAQLEDHFAKHGREFGRLTIDSYLAMAQALRDASPGGTVLEIVRPVDGVISRFDRSTGAFLAFDADGTIRTFFKPNDGEAYFRRQANRRPAS